MSAGEVKALRDLAASARSLADRVTDQFAVEGLRRYAAQLDTQGNELEAAETVLPDAAAIPSVEPTTGPEMVAATKRPEPPEAGET